MTQRSVFADPLLDVRALSVWFGEARAVRDVSFQLAAGEILALVGESGSGKSTIALSLLRLLSGQARQSGSVRFAGEELMLLPEAVLQQRRGADIAMIFQDPGAALNPLMTIGQQICESLRLHRRVSPRAARLRAIELLDQVHIAHPGRHVDSYPHELSGGMKQRAMIAMAIACRPKLLIADEPTTALDASSRGAVLDLLEQLRVDLGLSILLISHDLGMVGERADRVAVMYAGSICEQAEADEIFRAARHPYTRGLFAASPLFSAVRHYTEGPLTEVPGTLARTARGCAFAPRCGLAQDTCRYDQPPLLPIDANGSHELACPIVAVTEKRHVPAAAE